MEELLFRTSSYTGEKECVEVADGATTNYVRDTKDRQGPCLAVPSEQWAAFVSTAKADGFQLTRP